MGEQVAGGAVEGEGLPVGGQTRPVKGHLLLQNCEFISSVDEKPDKIGKLKKGVVAARLCLFNNFLCQSGILGLTSLSHLSGVGAQEASLVMETPAEEMIEG